MLLGYEQGIYTRRNYPSHITLKFFFSNKTLATRYTPERLNVELVSDLKYHYKMGVEYMKKVQEHNIPSDPSQHT